jgi:hypothetical protein
MNPCAICPPIRPLTSVGEINGVPLCGEHRRIVAMKRLGLTEADLTASPKED